MGQRLGKISCVVVGGLVLAGALPLGVAHAQQAQLLPLLNVTASRIGEGIVGTSTTVITAQDIERSPSHSLQDILSREPGIQVTNPFGGVNGARSVVDMRGFGAAAASNTLVLVNGRRITDPDSVGTDLAAIPKEAIERIEITRGNSGVVLYGDGAMGGVINIITKSGVGQKPQARIEGTFGSFNYREGVGQARGSQGPWSGSVVAKLLNSDGYRDHNEYQARNGVGDLRYTTDQGSFYFNLAGDSHRLGLPGGRRHELQAGLNQIANAPRVATTPYDFGERESYNATTGVTWNMAPGAELVLDGGLRHKHERAQFYVSTFTNPSLRPSSAVDTMLTTASFTPRMVLNSNFGGVPWKATGGFDFYNSDYDSNRPLQLDGAPIHYFDMTQSSTAGYWQQTVSILPSTDISGGVRLQQTKLRARDVFNPIAPGANPVQCFFGFCFGDLAGTPLDKTDTNEGYHFGVEHRFNENITVFGRWAKSFRVPNVDERVGAVTSGNAIPTNFDLRPQRSRDLEGGVRLHYGPLDVQWSYYDMALSDELHFRFGPFFETNTINLEPTHRYGHETIASLRLNDQVRLKGGVAYTRAVFREGIFAGNDVPLVSRWTGNAGVVWDIMPKLLTFDAVVRYVGDRHMDNDQVSLQPLIPENVTVDARLGGEIQNLFWSVAVQNLFDVQYFDYAIASPFPFGFASQQNVYNAYPQPGRTYLVKLGMTW